MFTYYEYLYYNKDGDFMQKAKIIFMGTPCFCVPILNMLIDNYDVSLVVTQPDKEAGRGKELKKSEVKKVALERNIEVFQPTRIRNDYEIIKEKQPDLIVTCAYGQILPKELLMIPKYGCINVHASLLPKWRGGAPIHRAIMEGDKKTGITIMYMDEHMDTGDIITTREVEIPSDMTTGELHDTLSLIGRDLLKETIPSILNGTNPRTKQDEQSATYAKLIKKEDEIIDFSKTAEEIYNQIRGLNPYPGATTKLDGKIMKIYKAEISIYDQKEDYGKIVALSKDKIEVAVKNGAIIFTEIKPEGKKQIKVKDYLNGINKEELLKKSFGDM